MQNILTILFIFLFAVLNAQVQFVQDTVLMGSPFRITVVDASLEMAKINTNKAIDEIIRIENMLSEWRPYTEVSQVNAQAGIMPVKVSKELIDLTQKALFFSEITEGAFDISVVAMTKIWKSDGSEMELPSTEEIQKSIEKVGYKKIIINPIEQTIFLTEKGMKIGFGSIGKGYAADRARAVLQNMGVQSGIVDASGDMALFGEQLSGKYWRIGINHPYSESGLAKILSLRNAAVTTSGNYEKFVTINGKRYGHIINPHTGFPSQGLISATVIGEEATTANGISTSIMVLGEKKGLELIRKFPQYACLIITDEGKMITSKNYKKVLRKMR